MLVNWVSFQLNLKPLEGRYCVFTSRHSPASSMMSDESLTLYLPLSPCQGFQTLIPTVSIVSAKERKASPLWALFGEGMAWKESRGTGHMALAWTKIQEKDHAQLWEPLELWSETLHTVGNCCSWSPSNLQLSLQESQTAECNCLCFGKC